MFGTEGRINTQTIKNKLSLPELPDALKNYFSELKPAKKRESEWKAFQELQNDYSMQDIGDCFLQLQKHGIKTGDENKTCHSPMAFLTKAMAEILADVEIDRRKARNRDELKQRNAEIERKRLEAEAREIDEWKLKERAFNKTFPTEERQREALADLLSGLPFRPNSEAGRTCGISRWWDGLKKYERLALDDGNL